MRFAALCAVLFFALSAYAQSGISSSDGSLSIQPIPVPGQTTSSESITGSYVQSIASPEQTDERTSFRASIPIVPTSEPPTPSAPVPSLPSSSDSTTSEPSNPGPDPSPSASDSDSPPGSSEGPPAPRPTSGTPGLVASYQGVFVGVVAGLVAAMV
ncbi:hypothetical protein FA15DRAFT_219526 [Coprinopsis marcescibilis]|uniref:Uncharacterized protein n=1 Tax=Coprinopsis marcescibilis TaxID=230819 RepID=A0A5C3L362_COPMA|nr:hypothetical protein FA15DRAFT_219526 [Coprinopsis marcescibilis]